MAKKATIHLVLYAIVILIIVFAVLNSGLFYYVKGSGKIETKQIEAKEFTQIELDIPANLYITQAQTYEVIIEAEDNVLPMIKTKFFGNTIRIYKSTYDILRDTEPINIYVSAPEITSISVSSTGDIISQTPLTGDLLNIEISGFGNVDMDVSVSQLNTFISGAGDVKLTGAANKHNIKVSGYGEIDAAQLTTQDTTIFVSGSAKASVFAREDLDVTVSGVANIKYKGEPDINKQVSGYATIKSL